MTCESGQLVCCRLGLRSWRASPRFAVFCQCHMQMVPWIKIMERGRGRRKIGVGGCVRGCGQESLAVAITRDDLACVCERPHLLSPHLSWEMCEVAKPEEPRRCLVGLIISELSGQEFRDQKKQTKKQQPCHADLGSHGSP